MLREKAGRQALVAWAISAVLAVAVVGGLAGRRASCTPSCRCAIALTTTALGTLLPILREQNMLAGAFGRFIFAAGAVGELLPILAISLFLGAYKTWWEALIIASIAGLAFVLAWLTRLLSGTRVAAIIGENKHATSQSTLRITVVLLVGLLLDHPEVRRRGRAGRVLRRHGAAPHLDHRATTANSRRSWTPSATASSSPSSSSVPGWRWTCSPIVENPVRLLVFFVLLLVVRGAPALLVYRKTLPLRERIEMMLLTATALPLLVALSEIGVDSGVMLPENAAALVGAGVLSVAIFPSIATRMHRRHQSGRGSRDTHPLITPGGRLPRSPRQVRPWSSWNAQEYPAPAPRGTARHARAPPR